MLTVSGIHVYYDAIHALKGVSFSIEKGELVTLLGANGAGKTTTLKTLSGLLRPRRGTIDLEGTSLEKTDPHEIVRRGVAHWPEAINRARVTVLLVEQNAAMALAISHRGYVLETGNVILEGKSSELTGNDRVRQAYLGG